MASFEEAYKATGANEGGWCHVDGDTGEETYCGISRKWFPNWAGWAIVDKSKPLYKGQVLKNLALENLKKAFYKKEFWDKINGDAIPLQKMANQQYDMAVNASPEIAKKLVKVLILCLLSVSMCYAQPKPSCDSLYRVYRTQKVNDSLEIQYLNYKLARIKYYAAICNKKKSQRQFLLGWINRVVN